MDRVLQERLRRLDGVAEARGLSAAMKGVEKESLRVTREGRIARTPHPRALGSALAHAFITTDYSEAQLEMVTPPFERTADAIEFLTEVHRFAAGALDDEMLWAASMPCAVGSDEDVPIAAFGDSNVGRMKRVYRLGLGHRYGRTMQAISGVHFNYSVPASFWPVYQALEGDAGRTSDFVSAGYFGLLRNFRRAGWLTLYLFGSSPAICQSFLGDGDGGGLDLQDSHTRYAPYGTSLRMSDIGYTNQVQSQLYVSVNGLDEYIRDLSAALDAPWPDYERLGVIVNGEYRQLNANILQIENEYYSVMRPKRVARSGETPTHALRRGGVEYVEMRSLDVGAFDPIGVNEKQLQFLETFLLWCLLSDSPRIGAAEQAEIDRNLALVARHGRRPGLCLSCRGNKVTLAERAGQILEEMQGIAALLDAGSPAAPYASALAAQTALLGRPEDTPSARVLDEMREADESFFAFAMRKSEEHEATLRAMGDLPPERLEIFRKEAATSLQRQAEIEASDEISFTEYLRRYFAQS